MRFEYHPNQKLGFPSFEKQIYSIPKTINRIPQKRYIFSSKTIPFCAKPFLCTKNLSLLHEETLFCPCFHYNAYISFRMTNFKDEKNIVE